MTDFPLTDAEVPVTSYVQWIVQYLFLAQNKGNLNVKSNLFEEGIIRCGDKIQIGR